MGDATAALVNACKPPQIRRVGFRHDFLVADEFTIKLLPYLISDGCGRRQCLWCNGWETTADQSGEKRLRESGWSLRVPGSWELLSGRQRDGIAWPMGKLLPSRGSRGLAMRHYPAVRCFSGIADRRGDRSDVTIQPQARLGISLFAGFFGPLVHSPP